MFTGNNKNTTKISFLRQSGVFIVNFEHFTPFSSISFVDFEQVNANWVVDARYL